MNPTNSNSHLGSNRGIVPMNRQTNSGSNPNTTSSITSNMSSNSSGISNSNSSNGNSNNGIPVAQPMMMRGSQRALAILQAARNQNRVVGQSTSIPSNTSSSTMNVNNNTRVVPRIPSFAESGSLDLGPDVSQLDSQSTVRNAGDSQRPLGLFGVPNVPSHVTGSSFAQESNSFHSIGTIGIGTSSSDTNARRRDLPNAEKTNSVRDSSSNSDVAAIPSKSYRGPGLTARPADVAVALSTFRQQQEARERELAAKSRPSDSLMTSGDNSTGVSQLVRTSSSTNAHGSSGISDRESVANSATDNLSRKSSNRTSIPVLHDRTSGPSNSRLSESENTNAVANADTLLAGNSICFSTSDGRVTSLVCTPDGAYVMAGFSSGAIRLFDLTSSGNTDVEDRLGYLLGCIEASGSVMLSLELGCGGYSWSGIEYETQDQRSSYDQDCFSTGKAMLHPPPSAVKVAAFSVCHLFASLTQGSNRMVVIDIRSVLDLKKKRGFITNAGLGVQTFSHADGRARGLVAVSTVACKLIPEDAFDGDLESVLPGYVTTYHLLCGKGYGSMNLWRVTLSALRSPDNVDDFSYHQSWSLVYSTSLAAPQVSFACFVTATSCPTANQLQFWKASDGSRSGYAQTFAPDRISIRQKRDQVRGNRINLKRMDMSDMFERESNKSFDLDFDAEAANSRRNSSPSFSRRISTDINQNESVKDSKVEKPCEAPVGEGECDLEHKSDQMPICAESSNAEDCDTEHLVGLTQSKPSGTEASNHGDSIPESSCNTSSPHITSQLIAENAPSAQINQRESDIESNICHEILVVPLEKDLRVLQMKYEYPCTSTAAANGIPKESTVGASARSMKGFPAILAASLDGTVLFGGLDELHVLKYIPLTTQTASVSGHSSPAPGAKPGTVVATEIYPLQQAISGQNAARRARHLRQISSIVCTNDGGYALIQCSDNTVFLYSLCNVFGSGMMCQQLADASDGSFLARQMNWSSGIPHAFEGDAGVEELLNVDDEGPAVDPELEHRSVTNESTSNDSSYASPPPGTAKAVLGQLLHGAPNAPKIKRKRLGTKYRGGYLSLLFQGRDDVAMQLGIFYGDSQASGNGPQYCSCAYKKSRNGNVTGIVNNFNEIASRVSSSQNSGQVRRVHRPPRDVLIAVSWWLVQAPSKGGILRICRLTNDVLANTIASTDTPLITPGTNYEFIPAAISVPGVGFSAASGETCLASTLRARFLQEAPTIASNIYPTSLAAWMGSSEMGNDAIDVVGGDKRGAHRKSSALSGTCCWVCGDRVVRHWRQVSAPVRSKHTSSLSNHAPNSKLLSHTKESVMPLDDDEEEYSSNVKSSRHPEKDRKSSGTDDAKVHMSRSSASASVSFQGANSLDASISLKKSKTGSELSSNKTSSTVGHLKRKEKEKDRDTDRDKDGESDTDDIDSDAGAIKHGGGKKSSSTEWGSHAISKRQKVRECESDATFDDGHKADEFIASLRQKYRELQEQNEKLSQDLIDSRAETELILRKADRRFQEEKRMRIAFNVDRSAWGAREQDIIRQLNLARAALEDSQRQFRAVVTRHVEARQSLLRFFSHMDPLVESAVPIASALTARPNSSGPCDEHERCLNVLGLAKQQMVDIGVSEEVAMDLSSPVRNPTVQAHDLMKAPFCVACQAHNADMCLVPCGHVCLCHEHSAVMQSRHDLTHCPLCKAVVEGVCRINGLDKYNPDDK